jgi:ethanolamine-phosphate cytidylyltransferase
MQLYRYNTDGCFDLTHFGHANALRQAKACGGELVVGLVPDAEILRCKGPPVLYEAERRAVVESIKWVDEMLFDVPYDLNEAFTRELYTKHRIDIIVHGDDPCLLPDGTDAYDAPKKAGKFKMIKRTEGVSTTDIVGRMLVASETSSSAQKTSAAAAVDDDGNGNSSARTGGGAAAAAAAAHFCTTSRRIIQFSNGGKAAPAGARVVYVHGAFDTFHAGHVHLLRAARELGDFLLVVGAVQLNAVVDP